MGRMPLPAGLKRRLVPLWNRAYWSTRRGLEIVDALARGRIGRCDVCGHSSLWLYRQAVIPPRLRECWRLPTRQLRSLAAKESSDCLRCGAKLRARRLARTLLDLYPVDPPAPSLAAWVRSDAARRLRVAEINHVDGLHGVLAGLPRFATSDYIPGASPGQFVDGVRSEDLERLTYPSGSLDLVVTSETLEHVPDLSAALGEIRRVLAPGGRHVFTIPVRPDVPRTFARSTRRADGTIEHHSPPICHPGGDVGYPVFTEFGVDVEEVLRGAGFVVEVRYGPVRDDDVAQVYVTRPSEPTP